MALSPALSPHGRLFVEQIAATDDNSSTGFSDETARWLGEAFARSSAHGLIALAPRGSSAVTWRAEFAFWREFTERFWPRWRTLRRRRRARSP